MKKLLLVFAHPNDESMVVGGTIAKYAKAGWQIDLICATGNIEQQKELERAAQILGMTTVTFLDLKDGNLAHEYPGKIEELVYKKMLELMPDIVITFEPAGITNDPDHKKISLSTTFAYQKYAKDSQKLYYACLPQTLISFLQSRRKLPIKIFEKPFVGILDKRIASVIDIQRTKGIKTKAIDAYSGNQELLKNTSFIAHEHFLLRMVGTKEAFMGKKDRVSDRL